MALKPGDPVAIRLVGILKTLDATAVVVTSFGGTDVTFPASIRGDKGFAWEPVTAQEPAYGVGSVYVDAAGALYLRHESQFPGERWQVIRHPNLPVGQMVAEEIPVRPLAHLTPEVAP